MPTTLAVCATIRCCRIIADQKLEVGSQPALRRCENSPSGRDLVRLNNDTWRELCIRLCGDRIRGRGEILLDFDSTDDPDHGQQSDFQKQMSWLRKSKLLASSVPQLLQDSWRNSLRDGHKPRERGENGRAGRRSMRPSAPGLMRCMESLFGDHCPAGPVTIGQHVIRSAAGDRCAPGVRVGIRDRF